MDAALRNDADVIVQRAIAAVMPDQAVRSALEHKVFPGEVILVAAGKAAWQMAKTAYACTRIDRGIVITKYDHAKGPIGNLRIRQAGHPVPDDHGFAATAEALELVRGLKPQDTVLFLLSGGGSALFEQPLIPAEELQEITQQLLRCGANIQQINTIRKRLSAVKGGRFAKACEPAQVYSIVLSDVIGDRLDVIASGPAYPDSSTCREALAVAKECGLTMSAKAWELLEQETPKELGNVTTTINGSVRQLCGAAADAAKALGYAPVILTTELTCEAKTAGKWLAEALAGQSGPVALIAGGETVVTVTGKGKGGRNQELALSAAAVIQNQKGCAVFSLGSDGTDGPTDAAGGYVDYTTATELEEKGILIPEVLENNDAYHALRAVGGLIMTGPTGTNVNDVAVALYR